MKIIQYGNTQHYAGYFKFNMTNLRMEYYSVDLHKDSSTIQIDVSDLDIRDIELYTSITVLLKPKSSIEHLHAYHYYLDIRHPTYSYT